MSDTTFIFAAEKPEDIKPRYDLNPGHWLYGKRAATNVLSGEMDMVVCESAEKEITLESVSCQAELWEKDPSSKPVDKPIEVTPEEKPIEEKPA
jgi:hypothetical protein